MINTFVLLTFSYKIPFNNFKKPYYFDDRIHNMGNVGLGGWVHAQFSPMATKLIDNIRYNGIDIRQHVIKNYEKLFIEELNEKPKILDMCCGVGISTLENQTGIDTSNQMIAKAKMIRDSKNLHRRKGRKINTEFKVANAEYYGNDNEFDCVTIMFAMHEIPNYAHVNIINNCKRISKSNVIIVDISPTYSPSRIMLAGEPYLIDYLKNFDNLMEQEGFKNIEMIDDHVRIWYY